MIYNNIEELVGNTPIVKFQGLYLKIEYFNPTGSVKDRPMLNMIKGLEKEGIIHQGDILVEASSGNTGISLAFLASVLGYKAVITMPDTMSIERVKIMEAYGATVLLTPGEEGMTGAIEKAIELGKEENHHYMDQFHNPDNPLAHELTTGPEIIKDFTNLDFVVCGVGTGGTIMGLARSLINAYPKLKVIGVEPKESAVINREQPGSHKIQGIGAGFIPPLFDDSLVDKVEKVSSKEALMEMEKLWQAGLFVGISSAGAIIAAKRLKEENPNATILVIIPDHGFKYLSVIE